MDALVGLYILSYLFQILISRIPLGISREDHILTKMDHCTRWKMLHACSVNGWKRYEVKYSSSI